MTERIQLKVVKGDMLGFKFLIVESGRCVFGRSKKCHVAIKNDDLISRMHFLLTYRPPVLLIRDIGSLNGTFVNDVKIGRRPQDMSLGKALREKIKHANKTLLDGDRITVGGTMFAVEVLKPPFCSVCGGSMEKNKLVRKDNIEKGEIDDGPITKDESMSKDDESPSRDSRWTNDTNWSNEPGDSEWAKHRRHVFQWTDSEDLICDECYDHVTDTNPTRHAIQVMEKPQSAFMRKIL